MTEIFFQFQGMVSLELRMFQGQCGRTFVLENYNGVSGSKLL